MRKKISSAFTLVEILLALAILGIGLVGILSVFVVGANSIRRTVEMTEASFLAQMVLEDFKRQGHKDPDNLNLPDVSNYDEYKDYECSLKEKKQVNTELYKVTLAVKKKDKEEFIVEFTTYLSKYVP